MRNCASVTNVKRGPSTCGVFLGSQRLSERIHLEAVRQVCSPETMLTRLKFEIQRSPKTVHLRLDQIGFDQYFIALQEKFVLFTCQRELELASIRVFSYSPEC